MTHILTTLSGSHVVQGIIVGGGLAFLPAQIIMNAVVKAMTTTVNGWSTTFKCGQPGNGILLRAACAKVLPAVNVVQEAAYWTTTVDSAGRRLSGQREYVLHFPVGQLPPNDAFWSLTMTDVVGYMVSNPIDRSSVGSRSGLVPNADGSIDMYLQRTAPAGHESNGPQVLHVPDMAGRYYSVQFTDPSDGTNFAYVGTRTTGTEAGDYLMSGPSWKGTVSQGRTQITSPNKSVLVIG